MTGLTVTDKETGKCVSISLSTLERAIGKPETHLRCCHVALNKNQLIFTGRKVFGETSANVTSFNLDLITSDQYAQAYLDYLFSDEGPVTKLENYFAEVTARQREQRRPLGCQLKTGVGKENSDEETREEKKPSENMEEGNQRGDNLKLSIVETQPLESQATGS